MCEELRRFTIRLKIELGRLCACDKKRQQYDCDRRDMSMIIGLFPHAQTAFWTIE